MDERAFRTALRAIHDELDALLADDHADACPWRSPADVYRRELARLSPASVMADCREAARLAPDERAIMVEG